MGETHFDVVRADVVLSGRVWGRQGNPVVILHGLAGSSREWTATARALAHDHRVALLDQRGHGGSTRHPEDVSRAAFVDDVVAVVDAVFAGEPVQLVGQSMGAHTAFLTAVARPDLVERLVMLEGHAAGDADREKAADLGRFFAAWPVPFADNEAARAFLGHSALATAWIDDLERLPGGLFPRFDAGGMERTLVAVHEPRWREWERVSVPTLAVFADGGMFTADEKDELFRRRPATFRADLADTGHDAHLDDPDAWVRVLRAFLERRL